MSRCALRRVRRPPRRRARSPPDAGTPSASRATTRSTPCSSWRAPRRRCCPGARAQPARCECRESPSGTLAWPPTGHTSLRTVQPLLNIAVRAARRAGEVIIRSLNRLESLTVTSKGRNDFVTEVDHAAEHEIIATIRRHYPQHAFLAEESGQSGSHETVWIIDPLDGTTNFLHGFPVFAVSIACQIKGRLEHAVVYDPMRGELFTASRGAGAHLENRRIRVSKARGMEGAL